MKKSTKIVVVAAIILLALASIGLCNKASLIEKSNQRYKSTAIKEVEKKYPGYKVVDTKLYYVDWSSTLNDIDKREVTEHRAKYVEVIIENDKSAKEILLKKNGFRWQIDRVEDYSDAPDNVYFAKFRKETWDINDKERMEQWTACTLTVPDKDGNLYQLETKEDGSKCYTSTTCVGLYKTKKGRVYEFFYNWDYQNNKPGKCSWVPSKNKYEYYKENNKYETINKKEARRIIRTYCPDCDIK